MKYQAVYSYSNAWAPLQHFFVNGLMNCGTKSSKALAINLVKKWINTNYVAFTQTNGTMFEKYDAQKVLFSRYEGCYRYG